jgi:hypothetical protein
VIYRSLSEQHYFTTDESEVKPILPQIIVTKPCCDR